MNHLYGNGSTIDVAGYSVQDDEFARAGYLGMSHPGIEPLDTHAWKFDAGGYASLTYNKTATVMMTLERIITTPVMDEVMRTYFERWKFRHPGRADFQAVVDEVVVKHHGTRFGQNMDWFFDQTFGGGGTCDYEVKSLSVREIRGPSGKDFEDGLTDSVARFESEVQVVRGGEIMLPVDIMLVFENGDSSRVEWDGKDRYTVIKQTGESPIVYAAVDPDRKIMLDVNFLNNSRSNRVGLGTIWKYAIKFLFWLQNIAQLSAVL
jgi:hypothetical protein